MWGLGFYAKVCVYLGGRKIFGILLWTRKNKTKQKDLATSRGAMGIVNHRPTLIIA
jgi:hypothetical protein